MLIRLAFGAHAGEVVDFLPHEARAMLADGRASLPDEAAPVVVVASGESVLQTKVKQRRTR